MTEWYREYDAALAKIPPSLQLKSELTLCEQERDGTIRFRDKRGNELAEVRPSGEVITAESKAAAAEAAKVAKAAEASKPTQPVATKAFVLAMLKGLVENINSEIKNINSEFDAVVTLVEEQDARIKGFEANAIHKSLDSLALEEIADRLEQLESAVTDAVDHGLRYRGFYRDGLTAKRGDAFTNDGSLWRAVRDTADKPISESVDWQLVCRKGRDAR